ncbi:LOW QUALITY PROTEIN: hypothetical protein Cgig2_005229 [Carnegiea gigantea]|uniref:R13L1/DRL21-like LRR repeat region domain-containing protein n=1 Tax=Carnegiea gigantea TaxID=171969 RepID=A0A9Q1QD24_9CARY|nr:LOW QUALITY PROTEIN: hypothetical protein Cgig2_005229 [Carnegiea gigantea]
MYNLKRWWRDVEEVGGDDQIASPFAKAKLRHQLGESFPKLLKLEISYCPNLKFKPCCPKVGNLTLSYTRGTLQKFKFSSEFTIVSLSGGLEHLTALEKLVLWCCKELDLPPSQNVEDSMPWRPLDNLQNLEFLVLPKLVALPNGLQHLTNPRTLCIWADQSLEALPKWKVWNYRVVENRLLYPKVSKNAKCPNREKWRKIQHIRFIAVRDIRTPCMSWPHGLGRLPTDIKKLANLRRLDVSQSTEANLSSKYTLMKLHIVCDPTLKTQVSSEHEEALLEGLQPHCNLKKLEICWYNGKILPSWAIKNIFCNTLPNLVDTTAFRKIQELPLFSHLPFLIRLSLAALDSVEYMESNTQVFSSLLDQALFFPSLQELELVGMPKLKGWGRKAEEVVGNDQQGSQVRVVKLQHQSGKSFPNLSRFSIINCPNLKSMPCCTEVKDLKLQNANEALLVLKKLKTLRISDVEALVSFPKECLSHLTCPDAWDPKLVLWDCKGLDLSPSQYVKDSMPWIALNDLQYLKFALLPMLVGLPSGLQHLTNLRSPHLEVICNLEVLPGWISCFSCLLEMELDQCSRLTSLLEGFRDAEVRLVRIGPRSSTFYLYSLECRNKKTIICDQCLSHKAYAMNPEDFS